MLNFNDFETQQNFSVPLGEMYFNQIVDLNEDGYDDFVLIGNLPPDAPFELGAQQGYFFINDRKGGFILAGGDTPMSYHPREVAVADFNGDGLLDVFIADHGHDTMPFPGYVNHLFLNAGGNAYVDASSRLPQFWDFSHSVAAGDIDGNGTIDLYVGNIYGAERIDPYLLVNDGAANFTVDRSRLPDLVSVGASQAGGRQSLAAEFVDVNRDGHLDLILGAYDRPGISSVFFNDGAGSFSDLNVMDLPLNMQGGGAFTLVQDIKAGDLNGDGFLDLVLLSTTNNYVGWSLQVLMGQADGSFVDETAARLGPNHFNLSESWSMFLTIKDVNLDAALDVVIHSGQQTDNAPSILYNDGRGHFGQLTENQIASLNPFFNDWTDMILSTPNGFQVVRALNWDGKLQLNILSEESPTDDLFIGQSGSHAIDGGGGYDTVRYSGGREDFTVRLASNGTVTVTKQSGTDTLTGIERIEFNDGALVFDIGDASAPAAYRLYGGAFDRTPDEGGLVFWTDYLDKGGTLFQAAAGFVASPEFTALYGANLSDADFVDQLYLNVLGREGEAAGVGFWNGYLADGGDRAAALVDFTQLPEYVGLSQANIVNGYWVMPS